MPGVPSSRACDGCRKQKQKCHAVGLAPPCARCHRLGIACVGFGKQRFKFINEGNQLVIRNTPTATTLGCSNAEDFAQPPMIGSPSYSLANRLTRLISAFISNIDPSADIKIQLPWNFGGFLNDVPRRLGTNEALDAASEALVTSYTHFIAGDTIATPDVLIKHSNALSALRRTLSDPAKAQSSETLCSTMILLIVQTLPGINGPSARSHSRGAAEILKGRGYTGPKDEFESQILLSLRGPVVVEALVNSQVSMTQQQWKDLVYSQIDTDSIDGRMMNCLAHIPDLMNRGRCALGAPSPALFALSVVQEEVRSLRDTFIPLLESLRERWMNTESSIAMQYPEFLAQKSIIHAHYSRSYGLALAIGIILNCMLAALEGESLELTTQSWQLSDEVVNLADVVNQYRPLGTVYMVLSLAAAWVGAIDPGSKSIIETHMVAYARDVQGPEASMSSVGLEHLRKRFTLQ